MGRFDMLECRRISQQVNQSVCNMHWSRSQKETGNRCMILVADISVATAPCHGSLICFHCLDNIQSPPFHSGDCHQGTSAPLCVAQSHCSVSTLSTTVYQAKLISKWITKFEKSPWLAKASELLSCSDVQNKTDRGEEKTSHTRERTRPMLNGKWRFVPHTSK